MIWISLLLVILVVASCTGVSIFFFRHLHRIESELWGAKQREADETARAAAAQVAEDAAADKEQP